MRRLTIVVVLVAAVFVAMGCGGEGEEGDLCDQAADCADSLVCVTQVLNCPGEECWGSCERECVRASDCNPGDVCEWVNGRVRVCRAERYDSPMGD